MEGKTKREQSNDSGASNTKRMSDFRDEFESGAIASYGFDREAIQARCKDSGIWKRGEKVFEDGDVKVTSRGATKYAADVLKSSGKGTYLVTIRSTLEATCECGSWKNNKERFCKHCVALALVWESEGGPKALDELSAEDQQYLELEQMSPKECKEALLKIARAKPDLISKLLFEDSDT